MQNFIDPHNFFFFKIASLKGDGSIEVSIAGHVELASHSALLSRSHMTQGLCLKEAGQWEAITKCNQLLTEPNQDPITFVPLLRSQAHITERGIDPRH